MRPRVAADSFSRAILPYGSMNSQQRFESLLQTFLPFFLQLVTTEIGNWSYFHRDFALIAQQLLSFHDPVLIPLTREFCAEQWGPCLGSTSNENRPHRGPSSAAGTVPSVTGPKLYRCERFACRDAQLPSCAALFVEFFRSFFFWVAVVQAAASKLRRQNQRQFS